jgi:hypothetical protein
MWVTLATSFFCFIHREEEKVGLVGPLSVVVLLPPRLLLWGLFGGQNSVRWFRAFVALFGDLFLSAGPTQSVERKCRLQISEAQREMYTFI